MSARQAAVYVTAVLLTASGVAIAVVLGQGCAPATASSAHKADEPLVVASPRDPHLAVLAEGQRTFRFDTFGSEAFWGGALKLHVSIAGAAHGGAGQRVIHARVADRALNPHAAQPIGLTPTTASARSKYRTAPLRGLWTHTEGGFYHDGRFKTLMDVMNHYDALFTSA